MTIEKRIKLVNILKWIPIIWIWCLPTYLAGLAVLLYSKIRAKRLGIKVYREKVDNIVYYHVDPTNPVYGVSLFPFIFLSDSYINNVTIHHEFGHCFQCILLGLFYLIFIGIPSGTSNIPWMNKLIRGRKHNTEYQYYGFENKFDFWWERQADKFGGICRYSSFVGDCSRSLKSYDLYG